MPPSIAEDEPIGKGAGRGAEKRRCEPERTVTPGRAGERTRAVASADVIEPVGKHRRLSENEPSCKDRRVSVLGAVGAGGDTGPHFRRGSGRLPLTSHLGLRCSPLTQRTVPELARITTVWVVITPLRCLTPSSSEPSVTPVAAKIASPFTSSLRS